MKTPVLEPLYKDIANLRTAASKVPSLLSIKYCLAKYNLFQKFCDFIPIPPDRKWGMT